MRSTLNNLGDALRGYCVAGTVEREEGFEDKLILFQILLQRQVAHHSTDQFFNRNLDWK